MSNMMNVNVLSEIVSYLNVLDDKETLNHITETCKLTDKEVNAIKEHWTRHTKYEIKQLPSIICWMVNNRCHRDDGLPAVIHNDGSREWWVAGQRHRDADMPAVEYFGGSKKWYRHGDLHRDNDMPAIIWTSGTREWYNHGKRHRDNDLPAVETMNGTNEWWINGIRIRHKLGIDNIGS